MNVEQQAMIDQSALIDTLVTESMEHFKFTTASADKFRRHVTEAMYKLLVAERKGQVEIRKSKEERANKVRADRAKSLQTETRHRMLTTLAPIRNH